MSSVYLMQYCMDWDDPTGKIYLFYHGFPTVLCIVDDIHCVQIYRHKMTEEVMYVALLIVRLILIRSRRSKRVKCSILQGEYPAIPAFFMC
jgi:hypothetical protein